MMADSDDDHSPGFLLFTALAAEKLTWTDVAVVKNETSIKLVNKDSDEARGKRMCATGQIVQIVKLSAGDHKIYTGLFLTSAYDKISYAAVGRTGELVENSRARGTCQRV